MPCEKDERIAQLQKQVCALKQMNEYCERHIDYLMEKVESALMINRAQKSLLKGVMETEVRPEVPNVVEPENPVVEPMDGWSYWYEAAEQFHNSE